jgi:hypothetical protein
MIAKLVEIAEDWLQKSQSLRVQATKANSHIESEEPQHDFCASLRHILSSQVSYSCLDSDDILRLKDRLLAKAEKLLATAKTHDLLTTTTLHAMLVHFRWDLSACLDFLFLYLFICAL